MEFHEFVSKRLDGFHKRPGMWATSNDTLEATSLMLLFCEVAHYCPEYYDPIVGADPRLERREVMEGFIAGLRKRYPHKPSNQPLHVIEQGPEFHDVLASIIHEVRLGVGTKLGIWGLEGKAKHVLEEPK